MLALISAGLFCKNSPVTFMPYRVVSVNLPHSLGVKKEISPYGVSSHDTYGGMT
jgi:hypothetical protein